MKKGLTTLLLYLFLFLPVLAQERTFQLWNTNNFELKINPETSVGFTEKIHYLPQSGDISLVFSDVTVKYKVNKWFETGAIGRILWKRKETGWVQEKRPMVLGNMTTSLGAFDFDFDNRMEYRFVESDADHFRYKHSFLVEVPPFHAHWFSVYAAEEFFYRFDREKLHLARVYSGAKFKYRKNIEMKLYYGFEKLKKVPHWNTSDIVGLNLNVDL